MWSGRTRGRFGAGGAGRIPPHGDRKDASKRFYRAVFDVLGIEIGGEAEEFFWCDELFVSSITSKAAAGEPTGRVHLAFQAKDTAMVDAFHVKAVAAGGKSHGTPGERPYHPG